MQIVFQKPVYYDHNISNSCNSTEILIPAFIEFLFNFARHDRLASNLFINSSFLSFIFSIIQAKIFEI